MYNSHYFTELIVKEKHRQWVAEADRLRQIKATKLKKANNRNRIIGLVTSYIKRLSSKQKCYTA
jgi:hypothetical protein